MPETTMTTAQVLRATAREIRRDHLTGYPRLTVYLDANTGGNLTATVRAIDAMREHVRDRLGVTDLRAWCNGRYRTAADIADAMVRTADALDATGGETS